MTVVAFIERRTKPVRVADGLVFSDQAELETHMTQQGKLPLCERSIEDLYFWSAGLKCCALGRTFTKTAPASAQRWTSSIASFRCGLIEGPARNQVRVGLDGLQHVLIADEKLRLFSIQ